MAVFVATVETGSMAAAARALELQPALIGQQIQSLEEQLGAPLFERHGAWQRLTAVGAAYHQQCRSILEMVRGAEADLQATARQASGSLRVHAPVSFGTQALAPALADFLQTYPKVQVSLVLDDRAADPLDDGYDLVFHRGEAPYHPQLEWLPLSEQALRMVASPAYLERQGCPQRTEELVRHACLGFMAPAGLDDPGELVEPRSLALDDLDGDDDIGHEDGDGSGDELAPVDAPLVPRVTVQANSALALHALALQGAGIAVLPQPLVAGDLAAGRLVALLPGLSLGVEPLGLLLRNDQVESPALAALVDWALGRFRAHAPSGLTEDSDDSAAMAAGAPAGTEPAACRADDDLAQGSGCPGCRCMDVEALA